MAKLVVRLLKSDMGREDKLWQELINYSSDVQGYIEKIGLELILNKEEGYAYLKQIEIDDEGGTIGLVSRVPMGFHASIVCVILREMLEEFDTDPTFAMTHEKFVTHQELKEHIELFFREKPNRVQFLRDLDKHINKNVEFGFLKVVNKDDLINKRRYIISRIIKEKVTIDILDEFKEKLNEYVESV
ncbi:MAG: DUF4194 domain-containing protein [Balneolales bacterium]